MAVLNKAEDKTRQRGDQTGGFYLNLGKSRVTYGEVCLADEENDWGAVERLCQQKHHEAQ